MRSRGEVHLHDGAVFGMEARREWILVVQQAWVQEAFPDRGVQRGSPCGFRWPRTAGDLLLHLPATATGSLVSHPPNWAALLFASRTSKGEEGALARHFKMQDARCSMLRAAGEQGSASIDVISS
jgi:hypothetical protein